MTTFNGDLLPLFESYRKRFGGDPPDLINLWTLNTYADALRKALDSGRPMPEAPGGENDIPVLT